VLVTGGAGFIGSNFVHYLQREEPGLTIVNLDALTYAANLDNLRGLPDPARHIFIEGDICDRDLVDRILSEHGISIIVHFAAESHVDRSIRSPDRFVRTNIIGTFTLLEAARQAWSSGLPGGELRRFHHVSTDEVYGSLNPGEPAFKEIDRYAPNSPYAASKAASDHLVHSYYHTYGLPVTITNCSNNYGPFQFPEKLIPLMLLNAFNGRPLPVYGDGLQVRDWLYVEDHCEAIWEVVKRGRIGETYNVGGDNQPPNIEVVREICGILDELVPASSHVPHALLCRFVADRPGHDRRYAMNIDKIRHELGWQPKEGLHNGLLKTVRWYLDNPDWIRAISARPEYQEWIHKNYQGRGDAK
jgi:dTDP-glucose 4,6-dehydratase